jgi:hypothetical protein
MIGGTVICHIAPLLAMELDLIELVGFRPSHHLQRWS